MTRRNNRNSAAIVDGTTAALQAANNAYDKKWSKLFMAPEEAYKKLQRRDEEQRAHIPTNTPEPKDWVRMNQVERNSLIDAFESRVYQVFGCFPKANWMI